jgi:hypothetical protein
VNIISAEEYQIVTTWDNRTIDHADKPVIVQLDRKDASSFKISVAAPLFNDPPKPPGEVGEPFYGLWNYEGNKLIQNCFKPLKSLFTTFWY